MSALLAEGTLYLNRVIDGASTGWKQVPGLTKFAISNSSEIKEAKSKDIGKYGQVIASVALPNASELSISIAELNAQSLAVALMGTDEAHTVAGAVVSTPVSVTAKKGVYVDIGHRNVKAGTVVVKNNAEAVTYVLGTDYELNLDLGMILTKGATIQNNDVLKITYEHLGASGFAVEGGTLPQILGALRLDGRNLADGKKLNIDVYSALLVSDGEIDFMSDEFAVFNFAGRMNTPTGGTHPYKVTYF